MKRSYKDDLGKTFNRLTLERIVGIVDGYSAGEFLCECGARKVIRIHAVKTGNTRSCGCLKSQRTREIFTTHGGTGTPEYSSYREMRKRCLNPKNHAYDRYGARGITICERWLDSYENFLADMGPRPSPNHSLDRIDNDKGYSPDNCRWATSSAQGNNRRSTRMMTSGGITRSHQEWAAILGTSRYMVTSRVDSGMSGDEVVAALTHSAPLAPASR